MTIPQEKEAVAPADMNGWWRGEVDLSRTPSPGIPAKRMRMALDEIGQDYNEATLWEDGKLNILRVQRRTPESLGYGSQDNFRELWFESNDSSEQPQQQEQGRKKMQTGCISCLYVRSRLSTPWRWY